MAKPLLDDELWALIEPLLPPPKPRRVRCPGRKPLAPRQVLTGILFVMKSGIPWGMLPQELGCGSGMTCWRSLRAWQRADVWRCLHAVILAKRLTAADWAGIAGSWNARSPGCTSSAGCASGTNGCRRSTKRS
jgi:transposase